MTSSPPPKDPIAVVNQLLAAIAAKADHFTLLQLPRNAEPLQIRDAYFRLAKMVHPDNPLFSGNPQLRSQATLAFQAITAANATLGDPAKRGAYMQAMLQAAMERSDAVVAQMQANNRATAQTGASLRPTGPQPHAVDLVTGRPPIAPARPVSTQQGPTAPGAMNRPMVSSTLSGSNPFSRGPRSGPQPITSANPAIAGQSLQPSSGVPVGGPAQIGSTGQFQRQTAQIPTQMGSTGQFQRPTPGAQSTIGPATTSSMQTRAVSSLRGLEPPPNEEVARIYLHSGRQQLNRRDWAGAQEALDLALPLLTKLEAADCKVMLGWAIFNNNANAEIDRIERPKAMWNEVATQYAKTPFHAQAAYYLAVWHKLHGELRHVMSNLAVCLELQPSHIDAAREKRLMEQRRSNLSEMQELEHKERTMKARRGSKTAIPLGGRPTPSANPVTAKKVALPKEQSWMETLFGGDKK